MTNEEAVKHLEAICESPNKYIYTWIRREALVMAKEALEKRMHQKVVSNRCPACGEDVIGSGYYCWNCGQRLEW